MAWNYRVFRETRIENGEEIAFYIIKEAYYGDDRKIDKWTEGDCAPSGNTVEELSNDLAWMIKALTLPVLSHTDASEIGPAMYLADEMARAVSENPGSFPALLSRSKGSA